MENVFGILVSIFRVLLGTMEQRPKVVRDSVLICVMLHNMLRTHPGRVARALAPTDDVAAILNELVVYVPDENDRNPMGEAMQT